MTAFPALAGEHYGTCAEVARLLHPACKQECLAELRRAHRAQISDPGGCIAGQGSLQAGDAFLDASRPRVDVPQSRQRDRSQVRDAPLVGDSDCTLKLNDRPSEFSAEAFEVSEVQAGPDEAEGVIERFAEPDSLLSMVASLVEHAQFGEGARQVGARHHCRVSNETMTLARQIAGQRVHYCPAAAFGPAMVAQESGQMELVVLAGHLERDIAESRADSLDLFRERSYVARATTRVQVKAARVARHRCQPALIAQPPGEGLGFAEIPFDPSPFRQREQSVSNAETKIDGLLPGLASLG